MRHHAAIMVVSHALAATLCFTASAQWAFPPVAPPAPPAAPADAAHHRDPTVGLLTPIPETGVPPIYSKMYDLTAEQIAVRGKMRDYAKQIAHIKYKCFGPVKAQDVRQKGIEQLQEFTDPAAFQPMIEQLVREADDVRLAMLDHFARQGDEGQAALGWVAIFDKDLAIRNEALKRMVAPAGDAVKYLLNRALRTKDHDVVCAAATVAGALNVIESIPLLIFAQATSNAGPGEGQGDIAWIAIQTQRAYVQNVTPIVGSNTGAFQPVIGIVSDGVVMRVVDAIVIDYLTPVHNALVAMSSGDWGKPTEYLSYNIQAWWDWYNTQYVPFKNEQWQKASLSGPPK